MLISNEWSHFLLKAYGYNAVLPFIYSLVLEHILTRFSLIDRLIYGKHLCL